MKFEDLPDFFLQQGIGKLMGHWDHCEKHLEQQFEMLGETRRVLAWDAPGYGASTPVAINKRSKRSRSRGVTTVTPSAVGSIAVTGEG